MTAFPYQLDTVPILTLPLRFLAPSLYLHGLEWLGQVVTLSEVLGPFRDVGLQQSTLLPMPQHSLYTRHHIRGKEGKEGKDMCRAWSIYYVAVLEGHNPHHA